MRARVCWTAMTIAIVLASGGSIADAPTERPGGLPIRAAEGEMPRQDGATHRLDRDSLGLGPFSNLTCSAIVELRVGGCGGTLRGVECLTDNRFDPFRSLERALMSGTDIPCMAQRGPGAQPACVDLSFRQECAGPGTRRTWTVRMWLMSLRGGRYIIGFREGRRHELNQSFLYPNWARGIDGGTLTVIDGGSAPRRREVPVEEIKRVVRETAAPLAEDPLMSEEEFEKLERRLWTAP